MRARQAVGWKLFVRFKKAAASFLGLLALASALIVWRQTVSIYYG